MKNLYLILFVLLQTFAMNAQTKIRLGDGTYSSNKVLYTIDGSLSITKIACLVYFIL